MRYDAEVSALNSSSGQIRLEESSMLDREEEGKKPQKNNKKKSKAKKDEEDAEEDNDELALIGSQTSLSFNEKVYLAIYIFVQFHRIKAKDDSVSLPFIKNFSIVKSTLATFYKEKALIANDFNEVSSEGKPTVLCRHLESAAKSLITKHL